MASEHHTERSAEQAPEGQITKIQDQIKKLTPTVLIVLTCLLIFEGVLLHYFVDATWVDQALHLTEHVKGQLAKSVDSGYSTDAIFHNKNILGDVGLKFYSTDQQKVQLYVHSSAVQFRNMRPTVKIQLNGTAIHFSNEQMRDGLPNTDAGPIAISDLLKNVQDSTLHSIRITSDDVNKEPDGTLSVEVFVLVSNDSVGPK